LCVIRLSDFWSRVRVAITRSLGPTLFSDKVCDRFKFDAAELVQRDFSHVVKNERELYQAKQNIGKTRTEILGMLNCNEHLM